MMLRAVLAVRVKFLKMTALHTVSLAATANHTSYALLNAPQLKLEPKIYCRNHVQYNAMWN